jgi:hypothetical protein
LPGLTFSLARQASLGSFWGNSFVGHGGSKLPHSQIAPRRPPFGCAARVLPVASVFFLRVLGFFFVAFAPNLLTFSAER